MPVSYKVQGPFALPYELNARKTKRLDFNAARECLGSWGANRGCYIFGIRGSRGSIKPYYVGKTSISFESECFTDHKLNKYNDVLYACNYGKPVMLLVVAAAQRGSFNRKALAALEEYLIGLGLQVNAEIKNIRGRNQFEPPFQIERIHTVGMGQPPKEIAAFRKTFALR